MILIRPGRCTARAMAMKASTIRPGRALDQLGVHPESTKEAVTLGITIVDDGRASAVAIRCAYQDLPLAGGPESRSGARRRELLPRRAIAMALSTDCAASGRRAGGSGSSHRAWSRPALRHGRSRRQGTGRCCCTGAIHRVFRGSLWGSGSGQVSCGRPQWESYLAGGIRPRPVLSDCATFMRGICMGAFGVAIRCSRTRCLPFSDGWTAQPIRTRQPRSWPTHAGLRPLAA